MGRARRSENVRREDRSPGGGTEEARRDVASLGSWLGNIRGMYDALHDNKCASSREVAPHFRERWRLGRVWWVAGLSMTLNASELSLLLPGVSSGSKERERDSWYRTRVVVEGRGITWE